MLYFIKNHQGYIKIGHTINLESRLKAYPAHGAVITIIDTCEGSMRLEKRIHKLLTHKGLRVSYEWYTEDKYIHKIWEIVKLKKWKPKFYLKHDLYILSDYDIRRKLGVSTYTYQ